MTSASGGDGAGTVFKIAPDGTGFTTLASLSGTGPDGGGSSGGLIQGRTAGGARMR